MERRRKLGRFTLLASAVVCLPCLLAPLAALGGAALLSTVGGFLSGNLWLVAGILLAGVLLAGGLLLRLRARRATSCELPARAETAAPRLLGADPRGPR